MRLYRLCRAAHRAPDGEGARLYGGRWSSPGAPVVYASATLSLAALEYLIQIAPADAPADLVAQTLEIPDDVGTENVDVTALPAGWEQLPEPPACKAVGDRWLAGASTLVLLVPSASVPEEMNVLLNRRHADGSTIRLVSERPFFFEPSLIAGAPRADAPRAVAPMSSGAAASPA